MRVEILSFKEKAKKYYKKITTGIVTLSLGTICIVTLTGKIARESESEGVILSLASVTANEKEITVNRFDASAMSYADMGNVTYEADQLSQLEKSEKQVDEILAERNRERKDWAELEALTQQVVVADGSGTTYLADGYVPATGKPDAKPTTSNTTMHNPVAPTETTVATTQGEFVGDFILTGYCPCSICCGVYSNLENPKTASGSTPVAGRTIAADTSIFPFGTQLVINGQVYTVEDRGGAIKGHKIDVYFNTHQEALNFGRRTASVYRP